MLKLEHFDIHTILYAPKNKRIRLKGKRKDRVIYQKIQGMHPGMMTNKLIMIENSLPTEFSFTLSEKSQNPFGCPLNSKTARQYALIFDLHLFSGAYLQDKKDYKAHVHLFLECNYS